ncbi:MAG TPA: tripartite tricarboxylate transporter substrate-binding protein [Usitatibacter sp.]|jgi:tripartite-type tricarboxylate transporter receptor subunit TctC|nr:tripartite tricarboxylate transporter substrate-binding protein [Usitatibacter sp.]
MQHAVRLAAAVLALALPVAASAQSAYPDRPIRMIVPLAAASAVDNAARIVAERMSASLGQPVVIENFAGASGQIGADMVAKAKPDGYTVGGFNDSIMTMLPNMGLKLPWDILRDFEPVSLVATVEWGLVANNNSPYHSAADLIAAARAHPGEINYSSGGNGSPQHIAMALFANQAGVQLMHVPYKGASQAAAGVAAGDVPVAFQGLATVAGLARAGRLRLIGVTTPAPIPEFPGVPTVATSGLPGFHFNSWFTVMAPARTPRAIIDRLNAEIVKALADPGVRAKLRDQGLTARGSSPEELAAATREQLARYAKLMKEAGIKSE